MKKDRFGPKISIEVHRPEVGLEGYLVIDNTTLGPGKGGIRMHSSVSGAEVAELARAMSLKNALAELPFGGAKGGIVWNHEVNKQEIFQAFIEEIRYFMPDQYIAAPDINTGEEEMGWLLDITQDRQSTTGKPAEHGGMSHKTASTGYGVAVAAKSAGQECDIDLNGATVAIDGYGNVGSWAAHYLQEAGAQVVATSSRHGAIHAPKGIDLEALDAIKERGGKTTAYEDAELVTHDEMLGLDVDVLITASVSDVIHDRNHHQIKAGLIVEGSNLPMSHEIEEILHERGITIVPDIVANAGGVIASYIEHDGQDLSKAHTLDTIEEKITRTTNKILKASAERHEYPRAAAIELAYERIESGQ